MIRIPINKRAHERRQGHFTNQRTISEYSVTIDREVRNGRTNARYLIDANIRDGVCFDLKIGLDSFIDKGADLQEEPCLHPLCKWAIAQEGATLKEVFEGAEFASWRGTMKRIASTLNCNPRFPKSEDAWTVVAQKFGGVILISEQWKAYASKDIDTYSGFKFEQYMTTDAPNGRPDTHMPVDNRPTFERMVRSNLVVGSDSIKLCCGAEVDALRGDNPIEFKTAWEGKEDGFFKNLSAVMQSEIVGVRSIVTGIKRGDYIVEKVIEKSVHGIKAAGDGGVGDKAASCYSFLFSVLYDIRKFLATKDACEVSFDPHKGVIEIKEITRQTARDNGNGVTNEFMKHFRL